MAESITFNGVVYSIPDTGDIYWGDATTSFLVAIPSGTLQPNATSFPLTTGDLDWGSTYGLRSKYYKSLSGSVASAGIIRLAKFEEIEWRNNAGNGNNVLTTNSSDQLLYNGTPVGSNAVWGFITGTLSNQTDLQSALDAKKTIATGNNYKWETTGATGLLQETTVTPSRAILSDANGLPVASSTTSTELGYVNGVTSAIQTQLDSKVPATRTISTTSPLSGGGDLTTNRTIAISLADTSTNGYLSSTDWNTFNNKLTSVLADGKIWIGSVGNVATAQTLSGDVTVSNAGVTAIGAGKVTNTMVASGIDAVKIANGSVSNTEFQYLDGTTSAIQTQLNARALTSTTISAGTGLTGGGDLSTNRTISLSTPVAVSNGGTGTTTSQFPIGTMLQVPSAPADGATWLACDGSSVSQSTYATLFTAIDHTYLKYQSTISATTLTTGGGTLLFYCTDIANGKWYVAANAGSNGTGYYSSNNGSTWSSSDRPNTGLAIVTNGTGTILSIRASSTTYDISTDGGATWSTGTGVISASQPDIGWNGTHFIQSGSATRDVAYSTDGSSGSWTTTTNAKVSTSQLSPFIWVNSKWFYTGSFVTNYTTDSTGATGWTQITNDRIGTTWTGWATNSTTLVMTGGDGAVTARSFSATTPIVTISDITNVTKRRSTGWMTPSKYISPSGYTFLWNKIFWNGKHWLFIPSSDSTTFIASSTDGSNFYANCFNEIVNNELFAVAAQGGFSPLHGLIDGNSCDTTNFRMMLSNALSSTTSNAVIIDPSINTSTNFNVPDLTGYFIRAL